MDFYIQNKEFQKTSNLQSVADYDLTAFSSNRYNFSSFKNSNTNQETKNWSPFISIFIDKQKKTEAFDHLSLVIYRMLIVDI